MKIMLCQFSPERFAKEANLSHVEATVRAGRSDLWVFPELATTGYLPWWHPETCRSSAEAIPGPTTDRLAQFCKDQGTGLVVGMAELAGEQVFNVGVYIAADGSLKVHRKANRTEGEDQLFAPGPVEATVFDVAGVTFALLVCADLYHPDMCRKAAESATVALIIANSEDPTLEHCAVEFAAAYHRYALIANRGGETPGESSLLLFRGQTQAVDTSGRFSAGIPDYSDQLLEVQIEADTARPTTGGEPDPDAATAGRAPADSAAKPLSTEGSRPGAVSARG
jgi:predicted amidohydrolase